jgi:hypothetical protein
MGKLDGLAEGRGCHAGSGVGCLEPGQPRSFESSEHLASVSNQEE